MQSVVGWLKECEMFRRRGLVEQDPITENFYTQLRRVKANAQVRNTRLKYGFL